MAFFDDGRCGRCGGDPFLAGTPYTIWVWFSRDPREHGTEAVPLHLCRPCGREFPSTQERGEYLKAVAFGRRLKRRRPAIAARKPRNGDRISSWSPLLTIR